MPGLGAVSGWFLPVVTRDTSPGTKVPHSGDS